MTVSDEKRFILRRMLKIAGIILLVVVSVTAVRLLLLLQDVAQYKKFWQDTANKPVPATALTYVVLGDSAAQSVGATHPLKGYAGLVAAELEKRSKQPVHIVNLSVSGASVKSVTDDQLPKLAAIKNLDKAVITIDIGANDVARNVVTKEEFDAQLDHLFSQLPKHTLVADLPSFGRTRLSKLESRIKEFNPIVYSNAKKHGLTVVPLYKATSSDTSFLTNSSDLFHPSNRGYRNWAAAFLTELGYKQ